MDTWMKKAACDGFTQMFYSEVARDLARAKLICQGCSVRLECLEYAFETQQDFGVWGGLSENERQRRRDIPRPGGNPPTDITYTTNARSTGATCSAGRTGDGGWAVVCGPHGTVATALNRTIAEWAVSRPEEWCEGCRHIAQGNSPKLVPNQGDPR